MDGSVSVWVKSTTSERPLISSSLTRDSFGGERSFLPDLIFGRRIFTDSKAFDAVFAGFSTRFINYREEIKYLIHSAEPEYPECLAEEVVLSPNCLQS